jgi:hypothetical protein
MGRTGQERKRDAAGLKASSCNPVCPPWIKDDEVPSVLYGVDDASSRYIQNHGRGEES